MPFKTEILSKWWFKLLFGLVGFGGLGAGLTYIGSLMYEDWQVVKDVKELKEWKDSAQHKVTYMMKHIQDEVNVKSNEYQVGLRFKKSNKKLYWRDKNREYREVFHDFTGEYYRDETDKKVYISDKY